MCKNDILIYIFNNKLLNDAIRNISGTKYDEFRSHLLMIMCEYDEDKLIELYLRNELDWFCLKIMTNQMRSKTSSWHKEYRNCGQPESIDIISYDNFDRFKHLVEDENIKLIDSKKVIKKIKELLEIQFKNPIVNNYHKTLFNYYYFNKLKLREIEEITNIHFVSVGRSIRATKAYIKDNINLREKKWKQQ